MIASDPQASLGNDLFFAAVVRGYVEENPRFVRRAWLAKELDSRLAEPGKRFVLLTAEPGAGKSAFMAQLAHDHPEWLRYFIRRDQRSMLADVSDKSLLLRIGYQLAAHCPELFSQEQLRLSVAQRIGKVAEQGEAVGAEIKRLTASPFYQKILQIEQQVQTNQGKVIGLRVEELVIETRLLSVEDLLHLALIDPARVLERIDAKQHIVVLIDALDEISYHPTIENIRTWLTNCPQLPENIRFVLTSRPPDEALKLFCDKQAPRLSQLTIAKEDQNVKEDIKRFLKGLVAEPVLAQAFQQAEGGAPAFAKKAADKAHGNLGYVDALARGIDQALAHKDARTLNALLSLKELPTDLEGLYAFFLRQAHASVEKQSVEVEDAQDVHYLPAWPAVYKRVLAVLAVAREPQSIAQIKRLGGIAANEDYLEHAVNQLLQFVQIVDGHLRFYHATVAEFLISPETRDNSETAVFYVDPVQWHGRIANYYWETGHGTWANCDAYGLNHLATHLFEGQQQDRLLQLISKEWMDVRYDGGQDTHTGFLSDIDLAWRVAVTDEGSIQPVLVRLQTARQVACQQVSTYSDIDLQTLVWLGKAITSRAHARLRDDADSRFDGLMAVYQALKEKGEPDPALLAEARKEASTVFDVRTRVRALCELAVEFARAGDSQAGEVLDEAYQTTVKQSAVSHADLLRGDLVKAEILKDLALACALTGDDRAGQLFREARQIAEGLDDDPDRIAAPRGPALLELTRALARGGRFAEAEEVARSINSPAEASEAFDELVLALSLAGSFDDAVRVSNLIRDEYTRVLAISALAKALHAAGDARSRDFFTEAYKTASRIQNGQRLYALCTVASALADAGESRANQVFAEVRMLAEPLKRKQVKRGPLDEMAARTGLQTLASALSQAGRYSEALEVARSIDPFNREEPLRKMGLVMAQRADAGAGKVFNEALEVADRALSNWPRVLTGLAKALAGSGYQKQARELANTIELRPLSPMQLTELTAALALAGCYLEAEKAAVAINDSPSKAEALRKLSVALARSAHWRDAQRLVNQIEDQAQRVWALGALAGELAAKSDAGADQYCKEALKLAESLPVVSGSMEALSELAGAFAQAGRYAEAREACRLIGGDWQQAQTLRAVAGIATQRGHVTEALEFAAGIRNPYWCAAALHDIAAALAAAGRYNEALQVANGIGQTHQPHWQVEALREVATALTQTDKQRSGELFREAHRLATTIEDKKDRANTLRALASAMAAAGDENADDTFEAAYEAANRFNVISNLAELVVNESDEKVRALIDLAVAMTRARNPRAGTVFAEARTLAGSLIGALVFSRELALKKLGLAFAQVGKYEESREAAALIQDPSSQSDALREMATALAISGDVRAKEVFAEAAAVANRITTDSIRSERLEKLATAQCEAGFFSDALNTLGQRQLDDFLLVLAGWSPVLERREPGSTLKALYEAAGVAGWLRSDWRNLQPLLTNAPAAPEFSVE